MASSLHAYRPLVHVRPACGLRSPSLSHLTFPTFSSTARRVESSKWCPSGFRRLSPPLAAAASDEPYSDNGADDDKAKSAEVKAQEQWEQSLKNFKSEVLKVKAMSLEVYAVYSKKAMEILLQTSEKLMIQADQAQKDLGIIMKEISEEGQHYFNIAGENSPEPVKDVAETFMALPELKELSDFEDYHIGIPYGTYLFVGGFLDFMLTGSIAAIRFGIILGGALLALSISSLRSTRSSRRSPLLLKGQAAIASIIFLREFLSHFQKGLSGIFPVVISGAVAVFYIYYMLTSDQHGGPNVDHSSES